MSEQQHGAPTPSMVDVFVRWKGYGHPHPTSEHPVGTNHVYDLASEPTTNLREGMKVRLIATSPTMYHSLETPRKTVDTYDPHIVGTVEEITGPHEGMVVVGVKNRCPRNQVRRAEVMVPVVQATRARRTKRLWVDGEPEIRGEWSNPSAAESTGETEALEAQIWAETEIRDTGARKCGAEACALEAHDYGERGPGLGEYALPWSVDGRKEAGERRRRRREERTKVADAADDEPSPEEESGDENERMTREEKRPRVALM
ncbi:hypothetical protein C8Q76DRAFT_793267 [Earliella scabrosa]|nr:hypothetical protein C8Q76DRAFT_793267 [Earliella scabrosa]